MSRTLFLTLVLSLAACSDGGSSSTSSTGATGSRTGGSTGTSSASGTGNGSTTGGASATTTGGASGGITADNFSEVFNNAYCNWALGCEDAAPYILTLCDQLVLIDFSDLPLAVDAGRVTFDANSATTCIAALPNDRSCSSINNLPAACTKAIVGQIAGNRPCYNSADCQSGSCSGNTPSTCSAGTCLGLVGPGASCDCVNCGVCDSTRDLTCFNQICAYPAQLGGLCGAGMVPCDTGLDCINGACATIPVAAGEACNVGNGDCQPGSYCFGVGAGPTGNCATQVALGQPCGQDADHQRNAFSLIENQCAGADVTCLRAGTLMDSGVEAGSCAKLSDIAGGCSPPGAQINQTDPYNQGCYAGLNCVSGACTRPPSSGPCSTFSQACDVTQSFCDTASTDDCLPYIAPGGSCNQSNSDECGLTGSCTQNNICQSRNPSCTPSL